MGKIKDAIISLIFMLFDVLIVFLTFKLAVHIRESLTPWFGTAVDYPSIERMMLICMLFVMATFLTIGLYPGYGMTAVKELQQTSRAITLVYFLLMGISYLNKSNYNFSRFVLLISLIIDFVILPLTHFALRNLLSHFKFYGTGVHIFGKAEDALAIENTLKNVRRMGWRVEAVYPLEQAHTLDEFQSGSITAILAADSLQKARTYERDLSSKYRNVVVIPKSAKLGSLWIMPRDLGGDLGFEFRYNLLTRFSIILKQLVDFIFSLLALVILSPMFIFMAVFIKIDSPGPLIYKQVRMGKDARPFQMYKFRTMYGNADEILKNLLSSNPAIRAEYNQYHKIRNDPRVTRAGKLLRRFSIDEFPQLFNVLAGKMSLCGPRPYLPAEKKEMGDYAKIILRVKPGISGWWQVLGRNEVDFNYRLEMDEFYISNWSVWMDIYIFLKTIRVIMVGRGF